MRAAFAIHPAIQQDQKGVTGSYPCYTFLLLVVLVIEDYLLIPIAIPALVKYEMLFKNLFIARVSGFFVQFIGWGTAIINSFRVLIMLGDRPNAMNATRNPAQNSQQNIND